MQPTASSPRADEAVLGQVLDGKYRLDALIGRGGMGVVFRAEHLGTGRPVAVKTILPRLVNNDDLVERFRREARAAGRLRHPNIVDVTDYGVASLGTERAAYLVMEYLEGSTLRELIEQAGPLPIDLAIDIVEQIALALDAAHTAGIVHRDLKPDNIWLVPDARGGHAVRILDFGIAKLREEGATATAGSDDAVTGSLEADSETIIATPQQAIASAIPTPAGPDDTALSGSAIRHDSALASADLTTAGSLIGTPSYMSPEQCLGTAADHRSDIYSLGIVAWQMLTGRRPFTGDWAELIRQHTREPAPAARQANPAVPEKVSDAVAVALAKAPGDRYPSARAMAGSIRAAAEGAGVVLRKAASLAIDRAGPFLRISVMAAQPALVLLAVAAALSPFFMEKPLALAVVGALLWAAVTFMTHGAFAALIEELRTRPLAPIDATAVFGRLNRGIGLKDDASRWSTFVKLLGFYTRAELKAPAGSGDLAFQIAFHEGRPPSDVGDRCRVLARSTKQSYDRVRLAIFASLLLVPPLEAAVVATIGRLAGLAGLPLLWLTATVTVLSLPLVAIVLNPILSSALALLYFRARQANGEDVGLSAVVHSRL